MVLNDFLYTVIFCVVATFPLLLIAIAILVRVHNKKLYRKVYQQSKTWTICPHCNRLVWLKTFRCSRCHEQNELMPAMHGEDLYFSLPCRRCGTPLSSIHYSGREELTAICPECNSPLGSQAGVFQEVVIPIVGRRATGKSAYLAALTCTLQQHYGDRISFPFPGVAEQVEDRIRQYAAGQNIQQTFIGPASGFVIDMKTGTQKGTQTGDQPPGIRLVLYDVAGEVYAEEKSMNDLKYFDFMDEMIILLDPFTVPEVRQQYAESLEQLKQRNIFDIGQGDFEEMVSRIKNGIVEKYRYADYDHANSLSSEEERTHPYLRKDEKHYARCAVVITKTDVFDLDRKIGEAAIRRKRRDDAGLSFEDALDQVCREQLEDWGLGNELLVLEDLFTEVRCFSVSAFGHLPQEGKPYEPQRVLLPLFWCLRQQFGSPVG